MFELELFEQIYLICKYKEDFVLNNLHCLRCCKTQATQILKVYFIAWLF